jgi:hypothetical protein
MQESKKEVALVKKVVAVFKCCPRKEKISWHSAFGAFLY